MKIQHSENGTYWIVRDTKHHTAFYIENVEADQIAVTCSPLMKQVVDALEHALGYLHVRVPSNSTDTNILYQHVQSALDAVKEAQDE